MSFLIFYFSLVSITFYDYDFTRFVDFIFSSYCNFTENAAGYVHYFNYLFSPPLIQRKTELRNTDPLQQPSMTSFAFAQWNLCREQQPFALWFVVVWPHLPLHCAFPPLPLSWKNCKILDEINWSHHITSHHITSHQITSHHITSHYITS